MNLEQKIGDFLTKAESKPARSKLAAYDTVIRTLRQRRWTFQAIAQTLQSEFGLSVNPKTIWAYLQVQREHAPLLPAKSEHSLPSSPQKRRFNLDA
jgi:IS30 family transposase